MGAVIWVVIVLVWGCVLIPMWLRRHDATGIRSASSEKLSSAIRVLSHRQPGTRSRRWTVPQRAERAERGDRTARPVAASARSTAAGLSAALRIRRPARLTRPSRPARTSHVTRTSRADRRGSASASPAVARRRRLAGLLALVLVTIVAAVLRGGVFVTLQPAGRRGAARLRRAPAAAARREREQRRAHLQRERRARMAAKAYETALAEADLADVHAEQQRLSPAERRQVRVVDLVARAERERTEDEALSGRRAVGG